MKVLVTGASGFMGGPVCRALVAAGHQVSGAVRRETPLPEHVRPIRVSELSAETDWRTALDGQEVVVHLAARAHVMDETESDPLALFRRVNRDGAIRLAEQAAAADIRRLIFISTVKAQGESGHLTPADSPAPKDPYGIAKWEAEQALAGIAARTGLELVVIRPPLVHGPGAKGNLASLMRLLRRRLPLPLASIRNRRSLVGVANLADLIRVCLDHPAASGRTLLVRDGEDVSTADLLRRLGTALGCPALLLPFPPGLLAAIARLLGKGAMADRLLDSLTVDDSATRSSLSWQPPQTLDQGLAAMAAGVKCGS